eukprot:SAG31_NODE_23949_length_492_cov_1.117048_1_plen_39_part_10
MEALHTARVSQHGQPARLARLQRREAQQAGVGRASQWRD